MTVKRQLLRTRARRESPVKATIAFLYFPFAMRQKHLNRIHYRTNIIRPLVIVTGIVFSFGTDPACVRRSRQQEGAVGKEKENDGKGGEKP